MSSDVGHGTLGLRSSLRDFIEFTDDSHSTKDVFVELRPIKEITTSWSVSSGTCFVTPFEFIFKNLRRDVVGVRSTIDTGLTRAQSVADCVATPGTFYYDPDEVFGQEATMWDLPGETWDASGEFWDQFPLLYINLENGSNPNDVTVVASIGFYFSGAGQLESGTPQIHPWLGEDLLTYGSFEDWSESLAIGWDTVGTGGIPTWDATGEAWDATDTFWDPIRADITQETSNPKVGESAVLISVGSGETRAYTRELTSLIVGKRYRYSGYYYSVDGGAVAGIRVGTSSTSLLSDGRNASSNGDDYVPLDITAGEWRRFIFDFRATATTMSIEVQGDGTSAAGTVGFDGLTVQRIYRYNWYEPRVSSSSLPAIDTGSNDIFFGGKAIGSGSVSLLNHDGYMEQLVAELEWMNQSVLVDVGGQFGSDKQVVHADDWFRGFTGLVQDIFATDQEVSFSLQDQRVFFHIKLPPNLYDDTEFATMDLREQGTVRPLLFGVKENISPVRIIEDPSTGYGTYEICDCTNAPNGIKQVTSVYAYTSKEAADLQRSDERIELNGNTDYTSDLDLGRVAIDLDVGPYRINDRDRRLDFDIGGSELTAVLTSGLYTAAELAAEIETQMRSVGNGDENCDYSETNHKFTISKDSGTLNLLVKTGTNADSSPWFALGFDKGSDKTGSLTYTASDAVFDDVDSDHIIRIDANGYKDDISGTYTGTPEGLIEIGADICRVLLVKYMGKSSSIIDEESFSFSRQRASESLALFINESVSTKDVFDKLEFSNIANIIVNGKGVVFYKVYVGDIPAGITTLYDHDFESFSSGRSNSEVFTKIRVKYDRDPTSGNYEARESSDSSVIVRLGRPDIKEFETYIKRADNASLASARMLELSRFAARKLTATTIGGKMMKLEVGDKFQLSRRRAIARGGIIQDEVFRIISISKNPLQSRISFLATDDRVTVASQACVQTCQQVCESTCQSTCEVICQFTCEIDCQGSCEASCQVTCEQGCQESCQLGCQDTCETTCQGTCETTCQANCQGGNCQTQCETSCQGCAQTTCQTVCQSSCQGNCETNCQQTCELVPCQNSCQTGATCQTNCQTGATCQTTCETNCQSSCEFSCQSGCQLANCQFASEAAGF